MAKKVKTYCVEVAGEKMTFGTLKDLAEALGVDKVTEKDILSGLYDDMGVYIETETEATDEKPAVPTTPVPKVAPPVTTSEYPGLGHFSDQKALKKHIKKMSDSDLEQWAIHLGLTWKPSEHIAINRMRVAMAVNGHMFPKEAKSSKSKYSGYTTEQLVVMATESNVEYKPTEDSKILRMRVIMSLREAGYLA